MSTEMLGRTITRHSRTFVAGFLALSLVAATPLSPAAADTQDDDATYENLLGFAVAGDPWGDQPWIDPAELAGLRDEDLLPLTDFDAREFQDSTVFAQGVELQRVPGEEILDLWVDRHVRVQQVLATLDRDIDAKATRIANRRPRVGRLLELIDNELKNEARLVDEIEVLREAIAEYAVRAFISDEEIETALAGPSTELSGTRVVTDEVRADQVTQINEREQEHATRQARRAGHEEELRALRSELRVLRKQRLELLTTRRSIEPLLTRTAASYRVAFHERLPAFIEETDIPLVALNSYVIASRRMEEESPGCGIQWWMLAGIGKIESFHGHFSPSTLDINGSTTSDIRGPALDGRILSGAEFLEDGQEAPAATGRTEELEVPTANPGLAPEPPAEPDQAPAAPAADADAASQSTDPPEGATPGGGTPPAPPAPVIKRLALIRDSDGGALDGDRTYDRAVGPMQFIPQTWRLFNADGNNDGDSDPQNIYDAALASARYLCASTLSMQNVEGEKAAYFAYNHDDDYTEAVMKAGRTYAETIEIEAPDAEVALDSPRPAVYYLGLADPLLESTVSKSAEAVKAHSKDELPDW